ncbi:hypothetical protein EDB92DRAFT_1837300 [Lactarius akahatsu]|uniref:Uncharacterized protein n=1 Tax=Lactarius akahatsu TaxID=416441 RepID=A0AAD4LNB7_9AGAM|nr:hypothetical protein EDB92DRAFT_1837300 [Lactarius akahatsu]
MDAPPLDKQISVPVSFYHANQTPIERFRIHRTSPDPATAGTTQDTDPSARTMPLITPEDSTSACPVPSMAAVALRHKADLTSSDAPDFPSSAPFNRVLDTMLPTGPLLSLDSPVTRSNHSLSRTESHLPIIATTARGAPPWPISALDLGAATEVQGSPKDALHEEKDVFDSPSVNRVSRAITMTTPDLPPRSTAIGLK